MDANDVRTEVTTSDGKRHTIHVRRQRKTWTASGYAGGDFLEGAGVNGYEAAVENWNRAYERLSAEEN